MVDKSNLTNMSISDHVQKLIAASRVVAWLPRGQRAAKRRLFLTPEVIRCIDDPNSAITLLGSSPWVRDAFDRWVRGDLVFASGRDGGFLKPLQQPPPDIWELRVTEPNVQVRVLGMFIERDTLFMPVIRTRQVLGDFGSEGWRQAMASCQLAWLGAFPGRRPLSGQDIREFVSCNVDWFDVTRTRHVKVKKRKR